MVERRHSIFIGPMFLGFHRHDVINKYVSKEKVSRQICAPWRKLYFSGCGGNIKNMRALNGWCCVKERVATFEVTNEIIAKTVLIHKGQNWFEQNSRTVLADWQVKLTDSFESFLWIRLITHQHRDIEAFKIFDSNARGNMQVLRTWHFHCKTEKEETIDCLLDTYVKSCTCS